MHTDASGTNVTARRVTPGEFDLQSVRKYYWFPLSGQHNVAAARKCSQERPDIARELRLDCWTARPVYYPDRSMENYCTLSTFQNAKDKWNTPPHQIAIIKNIPKLWQAAGHPEAIGGSAAEVKNKDYREFAAMALHATGSDHLVTLLLQAWSKEWSDVLGPYMISARATDNMFEKVQQVYSTWESGQLSGRDGVKPAIKHGESGKAPRPGPGFELEKGVKVPVHWIQGTGGPGYLVAVRDPDVRSWKAMSTLGRRERLQLLRDILAGSVVLAPRLSKVAHTAGKHSMETYVEMVKRERAMLRMFHYFVFISDPHKKPSEWKEPFFYNLSHLFAKYCDQGLTSERWIDQRWHFKETSWVRSFPATLGGEDEKGEESFKKIKSLANKCPEEFIQFVNKLLRRSGTGGSHSIRMSGQVRFIYFHKQEVTFVFVPFRCEPSDVSDEMDCKEMFRVVKHLTCHTVVLDLCRLTQMGLVWELLKSHRLCIVLEGESMKFEFLTQFINKMVKTRDYASFTKTPPRHDEGRDLVYKVGQNVVDIWEFLFETKPQDRGEHTYVLRRRKVEKLLRGYHKAPSEREVSFLDRLETMYFDQQIGAFTIAGYVTCFVDGEDFDADNSEEESVDDTLKVALAAERQRACSPGSQRMGVPGTSSGSGGASSMAVSTDKLLTQPPTSSIVTPTQMADNTMKVASGGSLDPTVRAMLSLELVATQAPFAHSPSTIMELLRSRTPQQPPPDEPLEYEIGDTIPTDIRLLPGPIVCRDDYMVTDDATWGHHIIWHPQHFQPALARGSGLSIWKSSMIDKPVRLMDIIDMSEKILGRGKNQAAVVTMARDSDRAEVRMTKDCDRGAVQVTRVRNRMTVQAARTQVVGNGNKPKSLRGVKQQKAKDQHQAAVGMANLQDQAAVVQLSKGLRGLKKQSARDQDRVVVQLSKSPTVESNTTVASHWSVPGLTKRRVTRSSRTQQWDRKRSPVRLAGLRDHGGAVQLSAVLHLSKSHTVVSNTTLVQHSSARGLTKRRKSLSSRTRQWDRDQSPVQVASLRDQSRLLHLSKGHTVEPNTTGVHYWSAPSLTERRNS
ncbi:hypothetical protein CBR_g46313 [Chara braunii]|uniref:Uncharacterized protein n=1 Tax=Chara braunii TaxID=69332 RepID=A0A388M050_CHABU|nr:hypothetical protein CBR_g46313 [Chara braunii]|eukprot:GBG87947.1 hypothetical protein CBR_g46313 [Chara braunii]